MSILLGKTSLLLFPCLYLHLSTHLALSLAFRLNNINKYIPYTANKEKSLCLSLRPSVWFRRTPRWPWTPSCTWRSTSPPRSAPRWCAYSLPWMPQTTPEHHAHTRPPERSRHTVTVAMILTVTVSRLTRLSGKAPLWRPLCTFRRKRVHVCRRIALVNILCKFKMQLDTPRPMWLPKKKERKREKLLIVVKDQCVIHVLQRCLFLSLMFP